MRNIPFAFINEETVEQINRAEARHQQSVDGFAHLAATQTAMRGLFSLKNMRRHLMGLLERTMKMSGPNSIANLERALRAHHPSSRDSH